MLSFYSAKEYHAYHEEIRMRLWNHIFTQLKTTKSPDSESHSAETHEEFSMLAKPFVSNKSRGGFNKNKMEKRLIVPKKQRS